MYDIYSDRNPAFFIRQKLFGSKVTVFGLVMIVFALVIASLGYLIMPDDTPYANDGMLEIARQPPGFKVKVLKLKKDFDVPRAGLFEKMFFGQENPYELVPLAEEPIVEGDSVFYVVYPGIEKENARTTERLTLSYPIVRCVKSIYVGKSEKLGRNIPVNFVTSEDRYIFLDPDESVRSVLKEDLYEEFWEQNIEEKVYYLGTDKIGRDVMSRLMYGARISLMIGFLAVLISLLTGLFLGSVAGFFGGIVDSVIMWLMTVVWSLPTIMLVVAIRLVLQSDDIWVTFLAVGLTMWVEIARIVRGQITSIKQKQYVEAARALGFSKRRIIFNHILPNIVGSLIVVSASNFATAILVEAGLSFLGLGGPLSMPSWGVMIKEGLSELTPSGQWHLIILPCVCISLMVLAFNLLGNGLRDAYDPHTK
ncbi:ABC transporter permease [Limibacter armeniacum]|uniref:ABC transporter permease n=1 Tax=Limibacter armeniacum TaxID=466084 RepID=UPI002FE53A2C